MRLIKHNYPVLIILLITMQCISCEWDLPLVLPQANIAESADIYVAGSYMNPSGNIVATYWKNNVRQTLIHGGRSGLALAVYVTEDGTTYVSGFDVNSSGDLIATYWINNSPENLTSTSKSGSANDIQVSEDGTIYVVGWEREDQASPEEATIWIKDNNTRLVRLEGEKIQGSATSMYIADDEKIYIAGYVEIVGTEKNVARYWVYDGEKILKTVSLTNSDNNSIATSIFLSKDNIVYVSGYEESAGINVAKYWIHQNDDTHDVPLSNGSFDAVATSIYVSENMVYVAGYENNPLERSDAKYWIDTIHYPLTPDSIIIDSLLTDVANTSNRSAVARSIFVDGDDVYVAGFIEKSLGVKVAGYWKNKQEFFTPLTNGVSARSIFIIKR